MLSATRSSVVEPPFSYCPCLTRFSLPPLLLFSTTTLSARRPPTLVTCSSSHSLHTLYSHQNEALSLPPCHCVPFSCKHHLERLRPLLFPPQQLCSLPDLVCLHILSGRMERYSPQSDRVAFVHGHYRSILDLLIGHTFLHCPANTELHSCGTFINRESGKLLTVKAFNGRC